MNQKISEAAISYVKEQMKGWFPDKQSEDGAEVSFISGATYFQQSSGADEISKALQGILEIGKRDMSNPKYDGYFEEAKAALAKYNSFIKTEEDGKATIYPVEQEPEVSQEERTWTDFDMGYAYESGWLAGRYAHRESFPSVSAIQWMNQYENSHERKAVQISITRKTTPQ